ncbi:MAG: S41 family peptidase [Vagococcus sp.]|uniref:S41 family peptidase n=1 Tax=Vagococcus sp. TaxID=1933889 RepID=UPI002FCC352E
MKQKESRKISMFQYLITIALVAILASGATLFMYELKNPMSRIGKSDSDGADLDNVELLYELINSQYIEKVDQKKLVDGALKGMTEAIGDPHSTFLVTDDAKEFDDSISGSFEGIGATMTIENDYPKIAEEPIEGAPADKAKLKKGDVIVKVNGKDQKGKSLQEVVSKVRGKKGTSVKLDVIRGDNKFTVDIVRDKVPLESVTSKIDKTDPTVGYINIKSFNETTSDEFDDAITKMRKEGAKKFIFDVRGNPGGVLQNVEKMTSRFLKDGETIVKFEDKAKNSYEEVAGKKFDNGHKITEPSVILVDENSASASEIMAGALKANGFDVIGTKTFGKGTVQTMVPIQGNGEVKLTISKWLTPDGEWIHEKGVKPTIKVDYPKYLKNPVIDQSLNYKEGAISSNVKTINTYLKELGYTKSEANDTYTTETVAGIKAFQKDNKLEETGNADKKTVQKLEQVTMDHWKDNDVQYNKALEVIQKK